MVLGRDVKIESVLDRFASEGRRTLSLLLLSMSSLRFRLRADGVEFSSGVDFMRFSRGMTEELVGRSLKLSSSRLRLVSDTGGSGSRGGADVLCTIRVDRGGIIGALVTKYNATLGVMGRKR